MTETRIVCLKRVPKFIGKGVYRDVYRLKRLVLKVERAQERDFKRLQARASKLLSLNLDLREKLDFLPRFYGVVISALERDGELRPAVMTFHEYIKPTPVYSLKFIRAVIDLIGRAGKKGLVLDLKPSNFGRKGRRIYYLDEYGIGRGPIPPDVLEDLAKLLRSVKPRIRSFR